MLSRLSLYTGNREYSCSRNSARRSPTVDVSRVATMSGRGVITSRTIVSPKSTMLCRSFRSSPSMIPSCSPASRFVATSFVPASASSAWTCVAGRFVLDTVRAINLVIGPSARATGANDGNRISSIRSGSRPTSASGSSSSHTTTKATTEMTTDVSVLAPLVPNARASSAVALAVTRPSSSRTGMNSSSGSSRYSPSSSGRPLRSATSRSDNRISALNAASIAPRYTAAHASRKILSGIIVAPSPFAR